MRIACPLCGDRPSAEFHCGGTTGIVRPPLSCSDDEWTGYLFFRRNPKGAHAERWRHTDGCGLWFNVLRDTTTHAITAVCAITEAPSTGSPPEATP